MKNYIIALCAASMLFIRACASEGKVLVNGLKEGEAVVMAGSKASMKAEAATLKEINVAKSSARLAKEKKFFNRKQIDMLLDFIPDADYFKNKNTALRILREVLDDNHKEYLTNDFEEWYDGKKYDWEQISNTIESDLTVKKQLDERFRHYIFFQYSNTYFEGHCLKYMQSGKAVNSKFEKLKIIAFNRGFAPNSNLIKSINNYLKKNK